MYIRYISNFGKGGNLVRRGSFYKLCIFFTVIGCCVFRQIYVHGDNINEVISRVYAFCRTVPYPYKVVDVQYICIVVEHESVELCRNSRTFGTPPEPGALGLVERSPQNRDIFKLESSEFLCDDVHIVVESITFSCAWNEHLFSVEVSVLCVETLVTTSNRREPVKCESDNAICFLCPFESSVKGILIFKYLCETFCGCIIIVYVWRVSKQLETSECRTFACLFVYIVNLLHRIGLCVLTCYYLITGNLR